MFIGLHNHTDNSNYRLLDSTNRIDKLIEYTRELGHMGVAITDHETIGGSIVAQNTLEEFRKKDLEKWKDYKLILGNEIYLCSRKEVVEEKKYKFYHFILLAKDEIGHKQLRELSTRAWINNSFTWVSRRVPTYYDDLFEVVESNPGHLIFSTACAGGRLPQYILEAYYENPNNPDLYKCKQWINRIVKCCGKENFFLELQPSIQPEQDIINKFLIKLSKELEIPYIITTDAHYLRKEDRPIHEAFLKSQDDEGKDREVGDFYATTYVMSEDEIHEYLDKVIGKEATQKGIDNTMLIYNMVEDYSLQKPLKIPYIPQDITEPNPLLVKKYSKHMPLLEYFANSEHDCDRHMVREIVNRIEKDYDELGNEETYKEIETCLNSIKICSEKQHTQWSGYLLQTKFVVDTCWEAGTMVGCSRGSGGGFILLYILGINQINPLREEVPLFHWRFLNPERASPLDVDIDIRGDMRDLVIQKLKEKLGGDRYVSKVQTLLRVKSRNALQIAARGLGYPPEEGQLLSAYIKEERGIPYTLKQTYYGDEENGILPDKEFVNLINNKYKDIWEVAINIEGLINATGQHAGGVIISDEDMVNSTALMRTNSGECITQYDLHKLEEVSLIKWDVLAIDAAQKIQICLDLLAEDKLIIPEKSLKETYEKYLGVYNIERKDPKIWDMINRHEVMSFFQMEKQSGYQAIKIGKPRSLVDLSALNSVMRLMAVNGEEPPLERYGRLRNNIQLWYDEMTEYGLTEEEQKVMRKYGELNYGLFPNQENFMILVQDPQIGGFGLLWADKLRKAVA